MSAELYTDDEAVRTSCALETVPKTVPLDRGAPEFFGELPTVLEAAPMFRRAVVGYDRFEVDTYVQWAEGELASADREREHLVARHLRTRAALEEAQELLSHSSGGGEFLRTSRHIGVMLAAAADEAEAMRAEAETDRTAAAAQAQRLVADGERMRADAEAEASRMLAEAATDADGLRTEARGVLDEAEQTRRAARADAERRRAKARAMEQRAVEHAGRIRQKAAEEASVARLQARDEAVRMLLTAREERQRADAEASATRERLDRDAAARRAFLLAEAEDLEHRLAALRADLDRTARQVTAASAALHRQLRGPLARTRVFLVSRLAPWRSEPGPSAPVDDPRHPRVTT